MINFDNSIFVYLSICFSLIVWFFFYYNYISKKINIFDKPENLRKFHKNKVAPLGGIIFYLIFLIYSFSILFFDFESAFLLNNKQIIFFIVCSSFIFMIGLIDDKYNLASLKKIIIFILTILIYVLNDIHSYIFFIKFEKLYNLTFALDNFSLFFTIFSIFVFINALNMYDGINLQSGSYLLFLSSIFLIKGLDPYFFASIIAALILFLIFNYKNKMFLGNNGIYFLSFIFGIFFIKANNYLGKISTEEILILMLIPGLDMTRLFFTRLIKGSSPFIGDRNHIHHLLLKNFNHTKVFLIIFLLTVIPYLTYAAFQKLFFYIFFIQIFIYFLIIKINFKN